MTIRTCRPGKSLGVIGDAVTVLLPPGEKDRAMRLWDLVDGGASVEAVLDALLADGLGGLQGFVLLGEQDGLTRLFVRGPARATLDTPDGTLDVEGPRDAVWAERSVRGVTGARLVVEDVPEESAVPMPSGLLRVGQIETGTCAVGAAAAPEAPGTAAGPPAVVPAVVAADDDVEPVAPLAASGPEATQSEPAAEPEPAAPELPGLPPHEAPVSTPPADDPTHMGPQPGLEVPAYGLAGAPPAPTVTAEPVARLHFSNGEVVDVDRPIVIGRDPRVQRHQESDGEPVVVRVPSPNHEVSSTHLEVRPGAGADHGSAVVTDLGSTNGTVLVQPGLPPEDLQSGIAQQLVPGAIIDLGDGVTIQVTQP